MTLAKENILLVDDDIDILELLQRHLQAMNFHTYKAVSVKEALQILEDTTIDLLITDIQMPEVDGLQLVKYVDEHYPALPKLVITGYPSVHGVLDVLKSGETNYLIKPFTKQELQQAVDKSISSYKQQATPERIKFPNQSAVYGEMIGQSAAFNQVVSIIERVKNNKATVLIQGESGTGKELVARAIHYTGKYARAPFIVVNCGAIPENLLEAELFGYIKGAFTGADDTRDGFFQAANHGTIFLDEIGTASMAVQTKLLRVLQEKEVSKIGSRKTEKIDVRVIAATNSNLQEDIKTDAFRADLYYRLTVVEIKVPPLRQRKSDIPLLVNKFLQKYGLEYKDRLLRISPKALSVLERYPWPGNIRELENAIQRAIIMSDGTIEVQHLPAQLKYQINFNDAPFKPLRTIEKEYIERVLNYVNGNKSKAAEILEIDRKTLTNRLK
ncbi:sigma-54 dependent transcriptional regulator [Flavobacteriaceae bacterium F08102]|nr:sigma-54 dependent transcriptional regulator [Flavobacteriaceae bacterium F08102]